MIVRISTEGQYRLSAACADRLNKLDNRIVDVVTEGNGAEFHKLYAEMISMVRREGEPLAHEEIAQSDLILPPPDITIEEARQLFKGSGLIPD